MNPAELVEVVTAQVVVSGRVQGVCYRAFTQEAALELRLGGWVRNLPDGGVYAEIEGPRNKVEKLLDRLRVGPPRAIVSDLKITWKAATGSLPRFKIVD